MTEPAVFDVEVRGQALSEEQLRAIFVGGGFALPVVEVAMPGTEHQLAERTGLPRAVLQAALAIGLDRGRFERRGHLRSRFSATYARRQEDDR